MGQVLCGGQVQHTSSVQVGSGRVVCPTATVTYLLAGIHSPNFQLMFLK